MTIEELEELKGHAAEFVAQFTWGNVAANTKKCQKVFKELYYTIFNIVPLCSGCNKSVVYYNDLVEFSKDINYLNKKTNHMSRFKMFADQVPWFAGIGNYVTNASLTDELALQILAASKQHKQYFEVLPDGWEEEVDQYKLDSGKAAAEAAAKAEEEAKLKAEEQARIETEAAEKEAREAEAARLKAEEEAALKAEQDEAEKKAAAEAAAKDSAAEGKSKGKNGK